VLTGSKIPPWLPPLPEVLQNSELLDHARTTIGEAEEPTHGQCPWCVESSFLLLVCLIYNIKSARGNPWLDGTELTLPLTTPVFASVYPGVTEDPIPIVEENWAHALDHAGSIASSLDFDVLDGAVTKLGKSISLIVGMAVVGQAGLAWNLCASSGWPARARVRHWGRAF